jgi:hypothetical protein
MLLPSVAAGSLRSLSDTVANADRKMCAVVQRLSWQGAPALHYGLASQTYGRVPRCIPTGVWRFPVPIPSCTWDGPDQRHRGAFSAPQAPSTKRACLPLGTQPPPARRGSVPAPIDPRPRGFRAPLETHAHVMETNPERIGSRRGFRTLNHCKEEPSRFPCLQ